MSRKKMERGRKITKLRKKTKKKKKKLIEELCRFLEIMDVTVLNTDHSDFKSIFIGAKRPEWKEKNKKFFYLI